MIVQRANHRADQNQLVHALGQLRQVFANLDAGDFGADGSELAANFRRRIHFEIEDILVRRAARQENHDDGFVRPSNARLDFGLEQLWQRQAAQPQCANLQKIPTRNAIAESRSLTVDG
jgi:hypothetical protein